MGKRNELTRDDAHLLSSDNGGGNEGEGEQFPFSASAVASFRAKVDEFRRELIRECRMVARGSGADAASPTFVESAHRNLFARHYPGRHSQLGTLGGAFLGAALSVVLTGQWGKEPYIVQVSVFLCGIVGALMIGLSLVSGRKG